MKKIFSFALAVIAIGVFQSCVKSVLPPPDVYQDQSRNFVYEPTLLKPISWTVINDVAYVEMSNHKIVQLDVLTQYKAGDAFIVEAPVTPQQWVWKQESHQYVADGTVYNAKFGFSLYGATVCFVEKDIYGGYSLKVNKAVRWVHTPSESAWRDSYRGLSGISSLYLPMKGSISFGNNPSDYQFALP
jgi:hypothetical protein